MYSFILKHRRVRFHDKVLRPVHNKHDPYTQPLNTGRVYRSLGVLKYLLWPVSENVEWDDNKRSTARTMTLSSKPINLQFTVKGVYGDTGMLSDNDQIWKPHVHGAHGASPLYCTLCGLYTVWVQKKSPPAVFWHFPPNGWEFLINFLHT